MTADCVVAEEVLVAADAGSYDAFFRAHYPQVLRVCHSLLGDRARAEEVTQEAFVRLYTNWTRISSYERPDAWVRRVAIRLAARVSRRDRLRLLLERKALPRPGESPGTDIDAMALVARLPRNQRRAVVLHYIDDLPVNEVAVVMGCAAATARVHLHRGRKRLAELMSWEVASDG